MKNFTICLCCVICSLSLIGNTVADKPNIIVIMADDIGAEGLACYGSTIYTTFSPCLMCTKMIINAGLAEVVYNADYPLGGVSLELLREAGVKVRRVGG